MGITHSSGIRGLPECERLPSGEFRPVVQGKNTRTAHISPHCRPCAQPRHRRADNIGERGRVRPRTPPQHLATMQNRVPSPRHADVGAAGRTHQKSRRSGQTAEETCRQLQIRQRDHQGKPSAQLQQTLRAEIPRHVRHLRQLLASLPRICRQTRPSFRRGKRQSEDKSNAKPGRYRPVYAACKLREKERGAVCRPSDICRQTR